MKKIAIIILSALALNFAILGMTALAASNSNEATAIEGLGEFEFDIQKNLSLLNDEQDQSYFNDPEGRSPIVSFAIKIIDFAMKVIGSIAIILFIIAGFMFIVAQGNQQQLDNGKEMFKYAAIGLIIAFFSYTIVIFLQTLFTKA